MDDDRFMTAAQTTTGAPAMIFEFIAFASLFFLTFVLYLRLTHEISRRVHS
jgi:hypothetical protein